MTGFGWSFTIAGSSYVQQEGWEAASVELWAFVMMAHLRSPCYSPRSDGRKRN